MAVLEGVALGVGLAVDEPPNFGRAVPYVEADKRMGAFYVFDLDQEGRGKQLDLGVDGSLAQTGDCVFGE